MRKKGLPALWFLGDSPEGRFGSIFLWPHGAHKLIALLDFMHDYPHVSVLRILKVRHSGWASAIAWIYQFDNSKVLHLAAKTRYLRKEPKYFYFIFLRFEAGTNETMMSSMKSEMRNLFSASSVVGAGSHDHLFHMPDTSFEALRTLDRLEGSQSPKAAFLRESHMISRNPWPGSLLSKTTKVKTDLLVANVYRKLGPFRAIESEVGLRETPHFYYASGAPEPYIKYLRENLGDGLRYPYSPGRFDGLLSESAFENPVIVKELKSGRYLLLDGVHRASSMAALGLNEIEVVVI